MDTTTCVPDVADGHRRVDPSRFGWVELGGGLSIKPLHLAADDSVYHALLRAEPGALVERHRHTGEVHSLQLEGSREIVGTGEVIRPGEFVHEPAGNVDSWRALDDGPCVVHVVVVGTVDYLDPSGAVIRSAGAANVRARFVDWCARHGVSPCGPL